MDYNVVYEIDPNWSGYDKSVAQGMLYDFGEIYVDSYGMPIDDEYWVEDIRSERIARKEKKAMKKHFNRFDQIVSDVYQRVLYMMRQTGISWHDDDFPIEAGWWMDEVLGETELTVDEWADVYDAVYGLLYRDFAVVGSRRKITRKGSRRKAMRKRAAGPYYKWKKVDDGYYRYRDSDPEYYYELEQKGSGWQLDICDEYGYSQVDRILGEYGDGHDGFFDTPQDAVDWLNQNLPWLSGSWGNPIAEPKFRLGGVYARKAMRKKSAVWQRGVDYDWEYNPMGNLYEAKFPNGMVGWVLLNDDVYDDDYEIQLFDGFGQAPVYSDVIWGIDMAEEQLALIAQGRRDAMRKRAYGEKSF